MQLRHVSTLAAPTAVEYVPAEQFVHAVAVFDENVPCAHCIQSADDFAPVDVAYVPKLQAMHEALLGAPCFVEKVPTEQLVQTVAPPCENDPAEQLSQVSGDGAPSFVENVPALQS